MTIQEAIKARHSVIYTNELVQFLHRLTLKST